MLIGIELTINSRLIVVTKLRVLPEDTRSSEEQNKELLRVKSQPEFIDFLKQERFDAYQNFAHILLVMLHRINIPALARSSGVSFL